MSGFLRKLAVRGMDDVALQPRMPARFEDTSLAQTHDDSSVFFGDTTDDETAPRGAEMMPTPDDASSESNVQQAVNLDRHSPKRMASIADRIESPEPPIVDRADSSNED